MILRHRLAACTLREKCTNIEFFLVRIQQNTDQKKLVFGHFSLIQSFQIVKMPKNTQKRELRRVVQTMNVENNFCYQTFLDGNVEKFITQYISTVSQSKLNAKFAFACYIFINSEICEKKQSYLGKKLVYRSKKRPKTNLKFF